MREMTVYVATKNAGKLRELESLFADSPLKPAVYEGYEDPAEGDVSYADNAALKAHALRVQLIRAGRAANVLADDSGLEVYALDCRPGVLTAYYGGVDLTWAERRRKLLDELQRSGTTDRRARFVCALHFIDRDGRELAALGAVEGEIAAEERGHQGFSFDPVFFYRPLGLTFAELTAEQKDRVSHRAAAASGLLASLRQGGIND